MALRKGDGSGTILNCTGVLSEEARKEIENKPQGVGN